MTICTEHGDLMQRLARGRLDDAAALAAEDLRHGCEQCSAWWDETFDSASLETVDSAVADAFGSFRAPSRQRYGWMAAAAALVMAVGIASMSLVGGGPDPAMMTSMPTPAPDSSLVSFDFENGSLEGTALVSNADEAPSDEAQTALFKGDLESGDLSGWTTNG